MSTQQSHGLRISSWLVLVLVVMASMLLCVMPAKAQKITLKIVFQVPLTDRPHSLLKIWLDRVNAAAPNRLHIQYLGSYEVIPVFEQMDALKRGTVDMAILAPTFYSGLLPEGMAIQCMGPKATVPEIRKRGMVALQDEIHRAKLGVTYLGGLWSGDHHIVMLKKPVYKGDLTGFKIRAIPVQQPAVRVLGGSIITIPPGEVYTALQTALLDGAATPITLAPDYKYEEVTGYLFLPMIPMSSGGPLLVNVKAWDGLPEDVKKIIIDPLLELENQVDSFFGDMENKIIDNFLKKGLKKCGPTSPVEAEETVKKMIKAQWKTYIEERVGPVWLSKLNAIAKPVLGID